MPRLSAGLLMYRIKNGGIQVLLAHPGGPFFQNKDDGAWSIPKGEPDADEDLLVTAQREFEEETGIKPTGPFVPLNPSSRKAARSFMPGPLKAIATRLPSKATPSRWSGRRNRGDRWSFLKSTERGSLISTRPGRRSRRGRRR